MDSIPDNIQDLDHQEAIAKMKELAGDQTCHFCTFGKDGALTARPMATQQVDDDGCFWFFSARESNKNKDIQEGSKVHLFYGNPGKQHYLAVEGEAAISKDPAKIDELWTSFAKAWFQGGKDDPRLTLIKVRPTSGYYWDTKHHKMISFLKIMASIVTGKTMDDGLEGTLKV